MSNLSPQTTNNEFHEPILQNHRQQTAAFRHEIEAVQQELQRALADLYAPLADLARNQLQRTQPLMRAALVLTVGVGDPDHAVLHQQRLSLAAAQEMLYLALTIHKLLLTSQPAQPDEYQKTLMGGIILTGDYCFTRSAILAAQTDHVQVVEFFSQALKAISEGLLRNFFADRAAMGEATPATDPGFYDERTDLFVSGVQAAAVLAALPEETTVDMVELAQLLAVQSAQSVPYDLTALTTKITAIRHVTPLQQARLDAFHHWLTTQATSS
jgi:hypothetical protein